MDYEIEFFPVGDASKAGDAITVRYRDPDTNLYRIIVIDGGTQASGEAVVTHIRQVYGENSVISDLISTHPDSDHSSGLRYILEELPVQRLWAHLLWYNAPQIRHLFANQNWTDAGLESAIKSEYEIPMQEIFDLALAKRVSVFEPYAGANIGPFTVLSPTQHMYLHLLPQFRRTPEPNKELLQELGMWIGKAPSGLISTLLGSAYDVAMQLIPESWDDEHLREDGITAAENESSVVLFGQFGTIKVLLTGDAGNHALRQAMRNAATLGLDISGLSLIQVPHHGSRRNISPSVLNALIGYPVPQGSPEKTIAIASVPADDNKHPRKIVVNAFTRRGAGVRKTQGKRYRYHSGTMPERSGETTAQPFPFFTAVEAYD